MPFSITIETDGLELVVNIEGPDEENPTSYEQAAFEDEHSFPVTITEDTDFFFKDALFGLPYTLTVAMADDVELFNSDFTVDKRKSLIIKPLPSISQLAALVTAQVADLQTQIDGL